MALPKGVTAIREITSGIKAMQTQLQTHYLAQMGNASDIYLRHLRALLPRAHQRVKFVKRLDNNRLILTESRVGTLKWRKFLGNERNGTRAQW